MQFPIAADALLAALEVADDGVYMTDMAGKILFANRAMAEIMRMSHATLVGQPTRVFRSGLMSDEYYERLWQTVLSGSVWRERITNRRADGELYEAAQTITPVPGSDGTITHMIAVQRDLTRDVPIEDESARTAVELQRQLALKETHLTELTHRIKNDFTVARSALELQAAAISDPQARAAIHDASRRLAAAGRIYGFFQAFDPEKQVELAPFLDELAEWWRDSQFTDGRSLEVRVPDAVPPVRGALAVTVGLVLNELVTNATKHHGGPESTRVSVQIESRTGELAIRVADSGPGYPPEVIEGARSGLGLTIARAMLTRYDGTLRLSNQHGAVAEVALPLATPA